MNEFVSSEASLGKRRKRGGNLYHMGISHATEGWKWASTWERTGIWTWKAIRTFLSPSCLCFFVFVTCFHSLRSSFHVEENTNNPSLLLQFQPPTETDELALSHCPHSLERDSALPSLGQVTAFGQWGSLDSQCKHGCRELPMEIWQEASQEEGWLLGLADIPKDFRYNKKKATQDLDTNILDSKQEVLANVVFIVCSCQ